MSWEVREGDCLDVLRELPESSIDAAVCDPPYGIGFMGHEWDQPDVADQRPAGHRSTTPRSLARVGSSSAVHAGSYDLAPTALLAYQDWTRTWATEVLRVLKPGGHLVSFASARTNHRHVCGIEDAGFEIRDSLAWLFGEGFPKSHNLKDDWEGWGSALKPAHEPITLARAPLAVRAMRDNVRAHGTGALHIDACRIPSGVRTTRVPETPGAYASVATATDRGRWPANVVLDQDAAELLDEQSGELVSGANPTRRSSDKFRDVYNDFPGQTECAPARGLDRGGASRFFYCAKTSRAERNAGLDGFEDKPLAWSNGDQSPGTFQADGTDRAVRNHHPTVKPLALMRWLVRLVTPPGGTVLDPFAGSGTTGCAVVLEGGGFVGIEREAEYAMIARARIAFWEREGDGALDVAADRERAEATRQELRAAGQLDLLDGEAVA